MTCIVTIKHNNKVYIAGDRRVTWDMGMAQKCVQPKVRKNNDVIIGGCGGESVCTLSVDIFDAPPVTKGDADMYMYWQFAPKLKKLLVNQGLCDEMRNLDISEEGECELIVICLGRVYSVVIKRNGSGSERASGIIEVNERSFPYAIGCGAPLALGALLAIEKLSDRIKLNPKDRLKTALEVAAEVSPGCDNHCDIIMEDL